jgi:hypothetical protein
MWAFNLPRRIGSPRNDGQGEAALALVDWQEEFFFDRSAAPIRPTATAWMSDVAKIALLKYRKWLC